jgi:lipoprotein-releasing system ATP-binding protein
VLENVLVPTLAGTGGRDGLDRARQLLERVGLWPRRGHLPSQLSGGERQRAALCRALINRPLVVLADEPTGNLDPAQAQNVATLLLELHREQETVLVMVTHSLELASRFPRRAELCQGRLEFADAR